MPNAVWIKADIIYVMLIILGINVLFSFGMLSVFGNVKIVSIFSRYIIGLSTISVPIFWVNLRYKSNSGSLGLTKSNIPKLYYLLIIIISGLCYVVLSLVGPLKHNPITITEHSYLGLFLLPLSIYSFTTIVLSPIGEEILWRGFVYGYLRKRFGVLYGLILQALVFGLLHYNINVVLNMNIMTLFTVFVVGLITGFLYEKTGSIYPAIIFHCFYNYFSVLNIALHK